jgi:hypothetical protein
MDRGIRFTDEQADESDFLRLTTWSADVYRNWLTIPVSDAGQGVVAVALCRCRCLSATA